MSLIPLINAISKPSGGGAFSPIVPIASASVGSTDAVSATTSAIDTTGANFLVLGIAYYLNGGGTPTLSDSKGNTWTSLTIRQSPDGNNATRIFYVANATVGSGHTFTVADDNLADNIYHSFVVGAFSNVKTASPFDQQNGGGSNSSSTQATGSVTPSENNELLIALLGAQDSTESIDSGFTEIASVAFSGGQHVQVCMAYKVQTTATAENPTWTIGSAGLISAAIATFKHS